MHFGVPWNQFVLEATRNKLKGVFWTGKRKPGSTARQKRRNNGNKLISECTAYDFKDELERKKISHWLKSVSAFANTEGGALYFGVSNNGTVTGLKDIQADSDFISEKINAHLDPLPEWTLTPAEDENGNKILELMVKPGLSPQLPGVRRPRHIGMLRKPPHPSGYDRGRQ